MQVIPKFPSYGSILQNCMLKLMYLTYLDESITSLCSGGVASPEVPDIHITTYLRKVVGLADPA